MIATSNETTFDTVKDLTRGLAQLDVQQEVNARLQKVHGIMLKIAARPRQDMHLNSDTLHAIDFSILVLYEPAL